MFRNPHKPLVAHLLVHTWNAILTLRAWGCGGNRGKRVHVYVFPRKRCELCYWSSDVTFKRGRCVMKSISGYGRKRLAHTLSFNLCSMPPMMLRCLLREGGMRACVSMFVVTGDSFLISCVFKYCVDGVFIVKLMCGYLNPSMLRSPQTGGIRKQISPS